jgi:hypothetical protein
MLKGHTHSFQYVLKESVNSKLAKCIAVLPEDGEIYTKFLTQFQEKIIKYLLLLIG